LALQGDGSTLFTSSGPQGYINQRLAQNTPGSYTLKITARGTGNIDLWAQRGGGDYGGYQHNLITLTATAQTYSLTFNKPDDGYPIQFVVGDMAVGEQVYLSNASTVLTTPDQPVASGPNLITNINAMSATVWKKAPGLAVTDNADLTFTKLLMGSAGAGWINQQTSATAAGKYVLSAVLKGTGTARLHFTAPNRSRLPAHHKPFGS
jgi:hypothetical protein